MDQITSFFSLCPGESKWFTLQFDHSPRSKTDSTTTTSMIESTSMTTKMLSKFPCKNGTRGNQIMRYWMGISKKNKMI